MTHKTFPIHFLKYINSKTFDIRGNHGVDICLLRCDALRSDTYIVFNISEFPQKF